MYKLLSLDGGGIRGLIILHCLAEYEKKNNVRVPDLFNCYSGTSIGAILVGFFAYLKWSATEVLEYIDKNQILQKLMPQSKWDKLLGLFQFQSKYSDSKRREELTKLFGDRKLNSTSDHVLMTGFNLINGETIYFTSYGTGQNLTVVDSMLISSSAPFFFPSIYLESADPAAIKFALTSASNTKNHTGVWGVDGGLACNNPSDIMTLHLIMNVNREKETDIRVVSIGTGYIVDNTDWSKTSNWGILNWRLIWKLLTSNVIQNIFNESARIAEERCGYLLDIYHQKILSTSSDSIRKRSDYYLRINGPLAKQHLSMDNLSRKQQDACKNYGIEWGRANSDNLDQILLTNDKLKTSPPESDVVVSNSQIVV